MHKELNISGIIENEKYMKLILSISTIFFSLGYFFSSIDYFIFQLEILLWINVISFGLLIFLFILFKTEILDVTFALIAHIIVITLNLYLGIIHEAASGAEGSIMHVAECMCICIIPAILSGMTRFRWMPLAITVSANGCYAIAAFCMGNPDRMFSRIPSFFIVTVGIAYALSYLLVINRRIERENMRIETEQKNIMQLLDFTPKQWELIRTGRMNKDRFDNLIVRMNKKSQDQMVYRLREIAYDEEQIKQAIRDVHSGLTAADLELCVLIVKGRSSGEIGSVRGIHQNSVTAHRSRLRTKLGLTKGENLNDYLISIVKRQKP